MELVLASGLVDEGGDGGSTVTFTLPDLQAGDVIRWGAFSTGTGGIAASGFVPEIPWGSNAYVNRTRSWRWARGRVTTAGDTTITLATPDPALAAGLIVVRGLTTAAHNQWGNGRGEAWGGGRRAVSSSWFEGANLLALTAVEYSAGSGRVRVQPGRTLLSGTKHLRADGSGIGVEITWLPVAELPDALTISNARGAPWLTAFSGTVTDLALPPTGPTMTVWDGTREVPAVASVWDGTRETPATVTPV